MEKLAEATYINFNLFAQLVPVNVVGTFYQFLQLKGRYHEIFRSEVFIGNRVCLGRDSNAKTYSMFSTIPEDITGFLYVIPRSDSLHRNRFSALNHCSEIGSAQ